MTQEQEHLLVDGDHSKWLAPLPGNWNLLVGLASVTPLHFHRYIHVVELKRCAGAVTSSVLLRHRKCLAQVFIILTIKRHQRWVDNQ